MKGTVGLEMNEAHQLLVSADINLLR